MVYGASLIHTTRADDFCVFPPRKRFFLRVNILECGFLEVPIQFMQPQEDMPVFGGAGVMLNFKVDDVDAEHKRLTRAGLQTAMPLEDHPWGDREFSIIDPIGNAIYIHSDREPSDEFKPYYKG